MMKYAICNETFPSWTWEATCNAVAEAGYSGIEVAPFTLAQDVRQLDGSTRSALTTTAQLAGLDIVGLHWLLVSPAGLSLTSRDPSVRAETANYLEALVDFCADLGGQILVLGSPSQRRIAVGDTSEDATVRLQHCLERALNRAVAQGIVLCLEPLPKPEADFVLTLDEAVTLIQRFDHPALKTIFDVKSASSEGKDLSELIRQYAPWIAHVHANDSNRRGPGFGTTDFVPILHSLAACGYSGYVSVEVFDYTPDPITIARQSLAYMRACQTTVSSR